MAVTAINQLDATLNRDADGHLNGTITYQAITNSVYDGPLTVLYAEGVAVADAYSVPSLPVYGDMWSYGNDFNSFMFFRSLGDITLKEGRDKSRKVWTAPAIFSTKPTGKDPESAGASPLEEPWIISGSYSRMSRFTMRDKTGAMITNSSLQPKVVEVPDGRDTIHLEGNSQDISLTIRRAARFRCNSATFWGFPARSLLLVNWSFTTPWFGTTQYVHHSIDFEVNDGLWNEYLIDMGTRLTDYGPSPPVFSLHKDADKRIVTHEFPLNGTGGALNVDSTPEGVTLTKQVITEYNFANLGFPDPLPGPFVT